MVKTRNRFTSGVDTVADIIMSTTATARAASTAGGAPVWLRLQRFVHNHPQFSPTGLARNVITGAALGGVLTAALCLALLVPRAAQFGLYAAFIAFFHLMEFVMTACFNAHTLTWSSFLLDHSKAYGYAFVASFCEYWLEFTFFPSLKHHTVCVVLGALVCALGQTFRTGAMISAGSNFTHQIAMEKRDEHKLVTDGFFSVVRHPSYFGWFWWSIGTQVLLGNPVCALAYAAASWKFFAERIPFEENTLRGFFGAEFEAYRARTRTGIPFIK